MFDFFTDESFDIENTKQYSLSIQVSLDGFSFTAFDTLNNKVVAFKTTPLKISSELLLVRHLKDWLESEGVLKKRFKNVRIFVETNLFTLIPDEFSEDKLTENLNSLIFNPDAGVELTKNNVEALNARLIFPVHAYLTELLSQFFNGNIEILHPLSLLLSNPPKSEKRNCAIIIISRKYFYLIIYRNGNFQMANSFQILHKTDLVYHVLNTFQQLETSRNETELFVCGSMIKNTETEDFLKPYFNHISKLKTDKTMVNQEELNDSLQLYLSVL
jgi:hypothetical protein